MHIASKITLVLGAIMFVASVFGMVGGFVEAIDASESRTYLEEESSGTFTVNENGSWNLDVYLIHPVDCESLDLTIVDSSGADVIDYNWNYGCSDNERTFGDGERELYANIIHDETGMEYTLNSNVEVDISGNYCDAACRESRATGAVAIFGGMGGFCCSIPIIVLGTILAFTLNDKKTNLTMQSGQIPGGQVTYQTPVTGQVPITQTFNQTPAGQVIQPAAVPVTPITPPTAQQPSAEQASQPEQTAWWGDEPQQ